MRDASARPPVRAGRCRPAETGPSDGDFEDAYVTARYQVNLTEQEFRKVVGIINSHKNSYAYWYAPNYASNCLGYIGSIAKEMGLKVPTVPTMPKYYVQQLKALYFSQSKNSFNAHLLI